MIFPIDTQCHRCAEYPAESRACTDGAPGAAWLGTGQVRLGGATIMQSCLTLQACICEGLLKCLKGTQLTQGS